MVGIGNDSFSNAYARYPLPYFSHDTCRVETDDVGEFDGEEDGRSSFTILPVGGVYARTGHLDQHFTGSRLRRRHFSQFQDFRATQFLDDHSPHGCTPRAERNLAGCLPIDPRHVDFTGIGSLRKESVCRNPEVRVGDSGLPFKARVGNNAARLGTLLVD